MRPIRRSAPPRRALAALLLALPLAAGCSAPGGAADPAGADSAEAANEARLSGELVFGSRPLPEGATARLSVVDYARADAMAEPVATEEMPVGGRSAAPFEMVFPADRFGSRGRYGIRATVESPDGELLWTTDTMRPIEERGGEQALGRIPLVAAAARGEGRMASYQCGEVPVTVAFADRSATLTLRENAPRRIALVQRPAGSGSLYVNAEGNPPATLRLQGNEARIEVDGEALPRCRAASVDAGDRTMGVTASVIGEWRILGMEAGASARITFEENGNVSGSTGCNRFIGQYELAAGSNALTFQPLATTRRMCPAPLMAQERRILDALSRTDGFTRPSEERLELKAGGETVLAAAKG